MKSTIHELKNLKSKFMSKTSIKFIALIIGGSFLLSSCNKNDTTTPAGTVYYQQADQMARPAINTVFVDAAAKDSFNTTPPSLMPSRFTTKFKNRLLALNGGVYTTNALGQTADQFVGLLVSDVLNASTTGTTTFYDGTNVLTGRKLDDDVINVELLLIFGGPTGTLNPGLTNDHVDANDKTFLASFPYLATPW